ncbi:MAG TPA: hypothetical protein VFB63_19365 [Bryobacteraceae bacterium]|nr:hypothetical protein [Bryobacteraceae bacterium]
MEHSEYATCYVKALQWNRPQKVPTWTEVAAAYDAGLNHAIAVTPAKRQQLIRYFRALRIINGERNRGKK